MLGEPQRVAYKSDGSGEWALREGCTEEGPFSGELTDDKSQMRVCGAQETGIPVREHSMGKSMGARDESPV